MMRILSDEQAKADWPGTVQRLDLTRTFPWSDSTVESIYSSHMLEHLTPSEAERLLENCYRVLRPGGILRLAVPDLEAAARAYLQAVDYHDPTASQRLIEWLYLAPTREGGLLRRLALRVFHRPHLSTFDHVSLQHLLESTGFVDIRRREYRRGELPDLALIETRPESLFMEAKRPHHDQ